MLRRIIGPAFVASIAVAALASLADEKPAPHPSQQGKWTALFDGRSLAGWKQLGGKAKYSVEDGAIVGRSVPNTSNSFLCTEKTYGDFVLDKDGMTRRGFIGLQVHGVGDRKEPLSVRWRNIRIQEL